MKLTFANILMLLLAALGCSSCIYESPSESDDELTSGQLPGDVFLNLSVEVLTQLAEPSSRANDKDNDTTYFEGAQTPYERIKTLRVIIVRGELNPGLPDYFKKGTGLIEHNRLLVNISNTDDIDFGNEKLVFKVSGGEKKKIYLIANEASLKSKCDLDFVEDFKVGELYPTDAIENLVIKADPSTGILYNNTGNERLYIPMSESHEIDVPVPENPEEYHLYHNMFITRSAVKFSFSVAAVNGGIALDRFEDYYVTGFEFRNIADREYFLPRAVYKDDINGEKTPSPGLEGKYITEYEIPGGTIHKALTIPGNYDSPIPRDINTPLEWSVPLYFCESKYNPTSDLPYEIYMNVKAKDKDGKWIEGSEYTFGPATLPNLSLLPRNTHVKVAINIWKYHITAAVTLVPYIGVDLEPSFGF